MDENKVIEQTEEIIEVKAADEGSDGLSEDIRSDDNTSQKKRPSAAAVVWTSAVLIVVTLLSVILLYGTAPYITEVGEPIRLRTDGIPLYSVQTELSELNTDRISEHELRTKILGFIPVKTTLKVRDRVKPEVVTRSIVVANDCTPLPIEFVESSKDKTSITYSMDIPEQTGSKINGTLIATDEGGNTASFPISYTVSADISNRRVELGTAIEDISAAICEDNGLDEADLSRVEADKCGIYHITGKKDGVICSFDIEISDTTPPAANVRSFDIILGEALEIADFTENIEDHSEVSARFSEYPDFTSSGAQNFHIILEDTYGNISKYETTLCIHDIPSTINAEAGISKEDFEKQLSEMSGVPESPLTISDEFNIGNLPTGTYKTELYGAYSVLPARIIIEDTTPPNIVLRPLTAYVGVMPEISDFIESCSDVSDVTYTYAYEPDVSQEGNMLITIVAVDEAENVAEVSTTLKVTKDNTPPVIYGMKDIYAYEGDAISYRSGVYALDAKDGRLTVRVNSSGVNTSRAGTYTVYYNVTDSDGNRARASANVIIQPVSEDVVHELSDKILARIVSDTMTEREKARAIYDWCRMNIKYSTSTSHLMGHFTKAAYSGLTKHHGNCYTYYAVASSLLTRAGIENYEIKRNSTTNPHYWNLVEENGQLYHFDTCPQPNGIRFEVFMLGDGKLSQFPLGYYYQFNKASYTTAP